MKFLDRLFSKLTGYQKPLQAESATVKFERLRHWVDIIYKEQVTETEQKVKGRLAILEETHESLQILITELKNVRPKNERIDVLTKVTNRKHQLLGQFIKIEKLLSQVTDVQELYEAYDFTEELGKELTALQVVREEVSQVLGQYISKEYALATKITDTLYRTHQHLSEIFKEPINKNYLRALKAAENLMDRKEKFVFFTNKIQILEKQIEIEQRELDGLLAKEAKIKNDPKYSMEKQSIKHRTGKFSISFYDLQLKELDSKKAVIEKRIETIKEHLQSLKEQKKGLNIAGHTATIKKRVREDHNIELELVE